MQDFIRFDAASLSVPLTGVAGVSYAWTVDVYALRATATTTGSDGTTSTLAPSGSAGGGGGGDGNSCFGGLVARYFVNGSSVVLPPGVLADIAAVARFDEDDDGYEVTVVATLEAGKEIGPPPLARRFTRACCCGWHCCRG